LCLIFLSGLLEYPELTFIDARYRARGEVSPSKDIAIVGITQRCLNQLGKFPWPRTYQADLIDFLKKSGAKCIVMDIFFPQADQDVLADQRLASSIKNAGNVILPAFMPYRIKNIAGGDNFVHVENLVESMPDFVEGAASQGHINMIADPDGVYRKALLGIRYSEKIFFSLGIEAALKFLDIAPSEIVINPDYLQLRGRRMPLIDSKFMFINFSDVESKAARFAFSDCIKGLIPEANFKDKIVFVGQTTQGLPNADILQTPFKEKYGITIQANIANTILENFCIRRADKYITCFWIILLSIVTCIIMIYIRTWESPALVLVVFLGMCFFAINTFISSGIIIDFVPLSLAIICGFICSILFRIRFTDKLVKAKELELDSILQAGKITSEGLNTDNAQDVILATLINSIGARGLVLRRKNEKSGAYEKRYVYGSAPNVLKGVFADAEQKFTEDVIKAGKAVLVSDTQRDAVFSRIAQAKPHSIICAPLILKGEKIGAVTLIDKLITGQPQQFNFDEEDLKLFLILTQQTAISLENLRLFEEVNDLFLNSIKALAETIDAKDPYTHGHSQRVTAYALAICNEMGFCEEAKKDIMISAILHDIGKIGIKDVVLSKPARLTQEEKELFDQHPDIGSKIMKPINQLENIIPSIRHHHEAYDGTGYPDKLKGEHIPMAARIIAVADTFDAMTSNRPYRKAMPTEIARKEINKLSGKQFDPKVVDAFNKAYEKDRLKKQ